MAVRRGLTYNRREKVPSLDKDHLEKRGLHQRKASEQSEKNHLCLWAARSHAKAPSSPWTHCLHFNPFLSLAVCVVGKSFSNAGIIALLYICCYVASGNWLHLWLGFIMYELSRMHLFQRLLWGRWNDLTHVQVRMVLRSGKCHVNVNWQ